MPGAERVRSRVEDGIGRLQLNRPERRNAVDAETVAQARAAIHEFVGAGVRAAVLEARGPIFCAGRDRSEENTGRLTTYELARALLSSPILWAARVQGGVVGGGVMLTAACAVVAGTPEAWFQLPEAAMGFLPTPTLAFLEARLGLRTALDLCLSADIVPAPRALGLGLLDHVAPADDIDAVIARRLQPIATHERLANAAIRAWQSNFETPVFRARVESLLKDLGPES
jgi:enoyl-CoA hydratase/carnithine racemase